MLAKLFLDTVSGDRRTILDFHQSGVIVPVLFFIPSATRLANASQLFALNGVKAFFVSPHSCQCQGGPVSQKLAAGRAWSCERRQGIVS